MHLGTYMSISQNTNAPTATSVPWSILNTAASETTVLFADISATPPVIALTATVPSVMTLDTLLLTVLSLKTQAVESSSTMETLSVMFGLGRVERRLHSSSRVLVNSQELDPGASRDVLVAYLQVTSSQGSEGTTKRVGLGGTVDSSVN